MVAAVSATRFIALIALLLSTEPNATKAATVRDLLKSCGSSLDSADYSYCLGVMDGAEDWRPSPSATTWFEIL